MNCGWQQNCVGAHDCGNAAVILLKNFPQFLSHPNEVYHVTDLCPGPITLSGVAGAFDLGRND